MISVRASAATGLLLACVGASSHAQVASDQGPERKNTFRRFEKSLMTVNVDVESGEITRRPLVQDRSVSTCSTFPNLDLSGFVGVDTGSCACEWIDAGVKSGGKSGFVTGFAFAYCSAALDTLSGGTGGTAELFFREGYAIQTGASGAPTGTEVARFCLTGLPANTASSSFFGGFRCFYMTVTLGDLPMCLADGAIGWGWKFKDLGTDGVLAGTWPFLACVQSCSGAGPDGLGVTDQLDQYCPPGFLLTSFCFGSSPFGGYFCSISMDLREAIPTSTPTTIVTSPANPGILMDDAGTSPPLTSPKLASATHPYEHNLVCPPPCSSSRVEVRSGTTVVSIGGGCAVLLCQKPRFVKFDGPPINTASIELPKDLGFAGASYCVQGMCFTCSTGCTSLDIIMSNAFVEVVDI